MCRPLKAASDSRLSLFVGGEGGGGCRGALLGLARPPRTTWGPQEADEDTHRRNVVQGYLAYS